MTAEDEGMGGATEGEAVGDDRRLTERRNPRTRGIDRAGPREVVERILDEERRVPEAVAREAEAIAELVRRAAERLAAGGRLVYLGAGTSGRLGVLDAAECPPTFGTDPRSVQGILAGAPEALWRSVEGAEDDEEAGRSAVREAGVGPADLVVGIATSGTTPFVLAGLEEAAGRGAATAFLSCTEPPGRARAVADVLVTPLVGPEAIAGSTRLKAGTATKLVLNAITTGAMVRLGKVYDNLMVDLRAVSRKLVDRSVRIVAQVAGVSREEARRLLVAAGGSAKTAIAMQRLGTSRAVAERVLDASGGFLADALERFAGEPIPYYACYPDDGTPDARRAVVEALTESREVLARALAAREAGGEVDVRDRALVPLPSRWGPSEHLAHLLEFEREAVGKRVRVYRSGDPAAFFDWPPSETPPLADRPPDELLELFGAERARTAADLPPPGDDVWGRRGRIGPEEPTMYQFLRGVAHHDRAHALRIQERVHRGLLETGPGDGEA